MDKKNKIIYIVSDSRSGSTLLEFILSQSDIVSSIGEVHHLDSHLNEEKWGTQWDWQCSCGDKISQCSFWRKVLDDLKVKGFPEIRNTEFIRQNSNPLSFGNSTYKVDGNFDFTLRLLQEIYSSVLHIDETEVVIDSSKNIHQFRALHENSDMDLNLIFIVRDIRAVVLSKRKWQVKYGQKLTNLFVLLFMTKFKYFMQRRVYSQICKSKRIFIKYENLANYSKDTISEINKQFNIPQFNVPEYMIRQDNHSIGGTPNRMKKKIQLDNSWRNESLKKPFFHFIGWFLNLL